MRDAVTLEGRGVPAVVLVTEPFRAIALNQAAAVGLPETRIVTIEHPLAYVDETGVEARAERAVEAVARALSRVGEPGLAGPAP